MKLLMNCSFFGSLNLRKNAMKRPGVSKTVSTIRRFKNVSDSKLCDLKTRWMKKRTFNKMKLGVHAYNEWRVMKLSCPETYDVNVDRADMDNVRNIPKESLVVALCKFIPEVTKVRDGTDYPGKTLYEMVVCIQKFLNENNIPWRILDDPEFIDVRTVLDNVMKERALCNVGVVRRQAELITPDHEEKLWVDGVLGEQTPTQLRETVLFLLGINLGLRAVDEHYDLRRDSKDKNS